MARQPGRHVDRLVAAQGALIEVIEFLDPGCVRLSGADREKLPQGAVA
jgi:hypothetical protein